jgi:hypothetical protein
MFPRDPLVKASDFHVELQSLSSRLRNSAEHDVIATHQLQSRCNPVPAVTLSSITAVIFTSFVIGIIWS